MEFKGPSSNYLRQQTQLALAALNPLQKLDEDSERQALVAVVAHCQDRLARLTTRDEETIVPSDVGVLKVAL